MIIEHITRIRDSNHRYISTQARHKQIDAMFKYRVQQLKLEAANKVKMQ